MILPGVLALLLLVAELEASQTNSFSNLHSRRAQRGCRPRVNASDKPSTSYEPKDPWNKVADVSGQNLLDFFNFETQNTGGGGGVAQYISMDEAKSLGLAQVNGDTVKLSVDTTAQVQGTRKSIRMSSKSKLSAGTLVVADVEHIPTACGAWPALWSVAPDDTWPQKGEIDIVEGVNLFTQNAVSVHTKPGFVMKETGFSDQFMLGGTLRATCDALATNDRGCGLRDRDNKTFGQPFNSAKGGVFVLDWQEDYISVHFFARNAIPQDLAARTPSRSADWRTVEPKARFQDVAGQKTSSYFSDHVLVVNTNLCGTWPEGVWGASADYAGQPDSCAKLTGHDSCADYILNSGDRLGEAFWSIRSIQVYN